MKMNLEESGRPIWCIYINLNQVNVWSSHLIMVFAKREKFVIAQAPNLEPQTLPIYTFSVSCYGQGVVPYDCSRTYRSCL